MYHVSLLKQRAANLPPRSFYGETRGADSSQYKQNKAAEANLFRTTKEAEAARIKTTQDAEAARFRTTQEVEVQRFRITQESEAARYRVAQEAEGALFRASKDAEGRLLRDTKEAEGAYVRETRAAEAACFAKQKEAEGVAAMAKAYGDLANVMGGPQGLMQFLMLQNGTYEKLAAQNAKAIQGLQPKISVWNTGAEGSGSGAGDLGAPIRNIFQNLPPLLQTVQEQTGITPPSWLAQMPQQQAPPPQQSEQSGKEVTSWKGKGAVNGDWK